jgi:hypothetical protein
MHLFVPDPVTPFKFKKESILFLILNLKRENFSQFPFHPSMQATTPARRSASPGRLRLWSWSKKEPLRVTLNSI